MGETYLIYKTEEQSSFSYFYSPFDSFFGSAVLEHSLAVPNSHQFSSSYELGSTGGSSPRQKIIKVSNLPAEVSNNSHRESEPDRDERFQNFYSLFNDGSQDLSTSLQGLDPPHYRTDSVQYHSNKPSISRFETNTHTRATSEHLTEESEVKHSRQTHSWFDPFEQKPPPGFGI